MRRHVLALLLLALVLASLSGGARADEKPAAAPKPKAQEAGRLPQAWLEAMPWRPIGPANMGGRITSITVCEQDSTLWWAATASGGLLKTSDNGITFEHQFDREAVVSIGDVAVAPSNPKILWVGTGECNPRNSVSWGNGVYKSVDGGSTWKHMGLDGTFQIGAVRIHPKNPDIVYVGALGRLWGPNEARGLYKTLDGGKTWEKIWYLDDKTGVVDIQMHPSDPDTLLVAAYERMRDGFDTNDPAKKWGDGGGLWKTTDGGKNFKRITAGLPTGKLGRIGIEYFRKNPEHVYLVLESEKIGTEPENAPYVGITGADADVGAKLTNVVKAGPAAKAGLKKNDVIIGIDGTTVHSYRELLKTIRQHVAGDKVRVEVSRERKSVFVDLTLGKRPQPKARKGAAPQGGGRQARMRSPFGAFLGGQRPNLQEQQGTSGHEYGGVYRSIDGGESWTRINTVNPRPMYFSEIRVDPSDEKRIWVLGIKLWRSKDGGKTFTDDGTPRSVHVDHHALWIDPTNGRHLILGNDGGVYVSYDRGEHFDHLNHVAIGQFYDVGVGPRRDYRVYGGLQDNGSWGGPGRVRHAAGPTNEDWLRIGGGDGFRVRVDKHDPERVYFQSQNGNVGRRHLRSGERAMFRPRPAKGEQAYRFNWYTPFILSHHNSKIYYTAGNRVFRSLDRGNGMRVISPEITPTKRGSATALAESPRDPGVLYVGTDDGGVWMTRDGGHTWIDLYAPPATPKKPEEPSAKKARKGAEKGSRKGAVKPPAKPPGPALAVAQPDRRYVSWIEPSRTVAGRVYLVFDGHRSDDDRALVFVSEDYGRSWKALHGTLPASAGTTRVLREDIVNPDVLYLGTEMGAFVSIDRGAFWTSMNTNLPTVAVHQFAQHPTAGELIAGTHGRSLWVMDVTTLRQITKSTLQPAEGPAHLFEPAVAVQWRPEPSRGRSRTFVGKNPPTGARILYSIDKVPSARLEVRELDGTVVRTLSAPSDAGLHAVTWDLRANPKPRRRFGARVRPGTYRVVLIVGAKTYEVDLRVEMDPSHQDTGWMAHEDEAEERAAAKKAGKAFRYAPYDVGRDE